MSLANFILPTRLLTSDERHSIALQKLLHDVQHRRKLREHNRLLLPVRALLNVAEDVHHFRNFRRKWRERRGVVWLAVRLASGLCSKIDATRAVSGVGG